MKIEAQAYLRNVRNVSQGLKTRSKIIVYLREDSASNGREISKSINLSYSATSRHLRHMKREKIITRSKLGWKLTGLGQKAVTEYLKSR